MLKGKSIIQLFNAENGKEKERFEDRNMITNAISNLFTPKTEWSFFGSDPTRIFYTGTPAATKLLGGIMLWDDTITENPNNILPPVSAKMVGNAGGVYSGTNLKRGSYNTSESGEITGGYRHVWDFSTDRGNGTVKCATLTSTIGGNIGWGTNTELQQFFCGSGNMSSFSGGLRIIGDMLGYGELMGEYESGIYTYAYSLGKKLNVFRFKKQNPSAVSILTNIANSYSASVTPVSSFTIESSAGDIGAPMACDDGTIICVGNGSSCFNITRVNPITEAYEVSSIPKPYSITYESRGIIYKNHLYIYTSASSYQGIHKITLNGEYVSKQPSSSNLVSYGILAGRLFVKCSGGALMWTDGESFYNNESTSSVYKTPTYSINNHYPYIALGGSVNEMHVIMPYLASINNLDVPVVKTSDCTMKITYEVYEE